MLPVLRRLSGLLCRKANCRVVILGRHGINWMSALDRSAPVWTRIKNVESVLQIDGPELFTIENNQNCSPTPTVFIPLMEDHIANCPAAFLSLTPRPNALAALRDKQKFADFISEHNLVEFCPKHYLGLADIKFPCVIKRTDLCAGRGVEIAHSLEQLQELLLAEPWTGHPYVLQEFLPGIEYVAHCVCQDGKILWHRAYKYPTSGDYIRRTPLRHSVTKLHPRQLKILQLFLEPLRYSGPCNFDFKFDSSGQLKIMEINPRLGGSLMIPANEDDLRGALNCIINSALQV